MEHMDWKGSLSYQHFSKGLRCHNNAILLLLCESSGGLHPRAKAGYQVVSSHF